MTPGSSRFLRDNAFLVAAVSLPLVVIIFFLLASAVPRWLVAPPAYDLVISALDAYNQTSPRASVEFAVRSGKVEATIRPVPANNYGQRARLFLFDHATMNVSEIPIELPDNLVEGDPPRTTVVDALAGRQVIAPVTAPDGYQLESRNQRGPGIVGELFGMHRYDMPVALMNKGRVIPIVLPPQFQNIYLSPAYAVGWLAPR
jgi:hypothetical protein